MVLDAQRIGADQIVRQFGDGGLNRVGAALDDRLSPTRQAGIGFDLQKQPARRHDEGFQGGDFHPKGLLWFAGLKLYRVLQKEARKTFKFAHFVVWRGAMC